MLSNEQKSLLKRAQKQAEIPDAEYREALQLIAGVHTSTDPTIGDRHLDKLMGYFEAIYWQKVAAKTAASPDLLVKHGAKRQYLPFLAPEYWKNKNARASTSRDRYTDDSLARKIAALESELYQLGCNTWYVAKIKANVLGDRSDPAGLHKYKFALQRTIAAKQKKLETVPF